LELANVLAHSARFELEDTGGLAFAQQRVGAGVVGGNVVQVHLDAAGVLDEPLAIHQNGEVGEADGIHLYPAQFLDAGLLVLRDEPAIVWVFIVTELERQYLVEWRVGDNDASGVDASAANGALQVASDIDEFLDLGAGVVDLAELADGVERAGDGDLGASGD